MRVTADQVRPSLEVTDMMSPYHFRSVLAGGILSLVPDSRYGRNGAVAAPADFPYPAL